MESAPLPKNNDAIMSKIEVAVRVKPLGAGAGEIEWPSEKFGNKILGEIDAVKNTIMIKDKVNAKQNKLFKFPDVIVTE